RAKRRGEERIAVERQTGERGGRQGWERETAKAGTARESRRAQKREVWPNRRVTKREVRDRWSLRLHRRRVVARNSSTRNPAATGAVEHGGGGPTATAREGWG